MTDTSREALIKELRQAHSAHTDEGPTAFSDAADMLEADAQEIEGWKADQKENMHNQCELQNQINVLKAQQVAVPAGYALAMAVLQSSLYQFLDDVERAECDALIAVAQGAKPCTPKRIDA